MSKYLTPQVSARIPSTSLRWALVDTDSNLATITTLGYLNDLQAEGNDFQANDIFYIVYSGGYGFFIPTFTGQYITLSAFVDSGNVLLPVVDKNLAAFNGTSGQVYDIGVAGERVLFTSFNGPSTNTNIVPVDAAASYGTLGDGGKVFLITGSGAKQYRVRSLYLCGGSSFSGGGGDRDAHITDGTTVYSVIPAATLQALLNTAWGTTDFPLPPNGVPLNMQTVAGASLYVEYVNGTTDYIAGIMGISGLIERIA